MNDLDLCLEVASRSCQPLCYIRLWGSMVGYPSDSLASCQYFCMVTQLE